MKIPKVLVGCPTYDGMEYCLNEYIKAVKNLTYPNYDILLVDNSKDDYYSNKIKKYNLHVIKIEYMENPKDRIVESRNILRQKVLDGDYDYLFSLEQDVIPPEDIIERLLRHNKKVISGVYYKYVWESGVSQLAALVMIGVNEDGKLTEHKEADCLVRYMYPEEVEEPRLIKVEGAGLGCVLISKEVLEKIKFRYDKKKDSYDDMFFFIDTKKEKIDFYVDTSIKCKHLILNKRKKENDKQK